MSHEPQFEEMEPVSGSSVVNLLPHKDKEGGSSIKLEAVSNFRNLGGMPIGTDGTHMIRPGVVNRSASPTNATVSDEFWLLEVLSIKTLIDFRTTWENKTISPVKKFEDNFVQYSIKKDESREKELPAPLRPLPHPDEPGSPTPSIVVNNGSGDFLRKSASKEMEEQRNGFLWRIYNRNYSGDELVKLRAHSSGSARKRYCIPLINNKFFLEGVYQTAPNDTKLKCTVSRYLLFNDKIGALMLMNHLNDLGILEMYRLTLLYTQEELLTILRILKDKDNYPIMYFCSLGKDRTGMVTALFLSCLGVPRDLIVEDYSKSEGNIAPFIDQIKRYFTRVGLSKDEFVRSPKEVMAGLLSWVDETYGSVPNYLEVIGFSKQEQEEMKANLIVTNDEYTEILNISRYTNLKNLDKRQEEYIASKTQKSPKLFSSPRFWRRLSFSKELQFDNKGDNSKSAEKAQEN
eukprot:gene7220-8384_t